MKAMLPEEPNRRSHQISRHWGHSHYTDLFAHVRRMTGRNAHLHRAVARNRNLHTRPNLRQQVYAVYRCESTDLPAEFAPDAEWPALPRLSAITSSSVNIMRCESIEASNYDALIRSHKNELARMCDHAAHTRH